MDILPDVLHTRYLKDSVTICDEPWRLSNYEHVRVDVFPQDHVPPCRFCVGLVAAHNQREYDKDGMLAPIRQLTAEDLDLPEGRSEFFRGVLWGVFFSLLVWLVAILIGFGAVAVMRG